MSDEKACALCGGEVGPDITGRPMCYGCGPRDMAPTDKQRPLKSEFTDLGGSWLLRLGGPT